MDNIPFVDLSKQYRLLQHELEEAVLSSLRGCQYIQGPNVRSLEAEMAAYLGVPHAMGVSSGTDALLLSLMALDIKHGDEVITSPFTFFATAGCIHRVGATPVFVDVDPDTYNIHPAHLEKRISTRTKAIIPVHLFGLCADMGDILQIARQHGLKIIEDAAQAVGASCPAGRAGTMGDIGCFSFFPTKNLGCAGDGGMLVTRDKALAEKAALLRNHGAKPKYHHAAVGGNFRLDDVQAALLRVKLPHLEAWTRQRRQNAATYMRRLKALEDRGIIRLPAHQDGFLHIFNQFTIQLLRADRDAVRRELKNLGVATEIYYPVPLHLQKCFASLSYHDGDLPVCEQASRQVLSLPIFPELQAQQIDRICEALDEILA